jgi:3-methyladenine DNA glycosylase AlkD
MTRLLTPEARLSVRAADRDLVEEIRAGLRDVAVAEQAPQMQAYMKSELPYLGVRLPDVRIVMRAALKEHPPESFKTVGATAALLWREAEFREERYAATALTGLPVAQGHLELMSLHREMIVTGAWWDHVDEVSHRVGAVLVAHPKKLSPLIREWSVDPDVWLRRSSVIVQLGLKEQTDLVLLSDVILANAADKDAFLRKAIGWALREYARTDPAWVRDFVATHEPVLSPLSRREALKRI